MVPNFPLMLLAAALAFTKITLAFPIDGQSLVDAIQEGLSAIGFHTGDVTCDKDFPQLYKIHGEMRDMFEEAAMFRANAEQVCSDVVPHLYKPKIREHTFNFKVHDADIYVHSQRVLWDLDLIVVYKVTLTDKGFNEVHKKDKGVAQAALKGFCVNALVEYGTKDKGCTKDPMDFTNGIVRRTTTTGVLGGSMKWMLGKEHFATLDVSFKKPKKQVS
ncbi:hypothetical protein BDW62DRAFT_204098 [Aspergillus aurantiobrunneus]